MTFRVVTSLQHHVHARIALSNATHEIDGSNQYLDYEMLRRWRDRHPANLCARVCTFFGGGRGYHTERSPRSPPQHDTSGLRAIPVVRNESGRAPQSISALPSSIVPLVSPFTTLPTRPHLRYDDYWQRAPWASANQARRKPVASNRLQTNHRASVHRRGGRFCVQFSPTHGTGTWD